MPFPSPIWQSQNKSRFKRIFNSPSLLWPIRTFGLLQYQREVQSKMKTILHILQIRPILLVLSPVLFLLSPALAEGREIRTTVLTERQYDAVPESDTVLFAGLWKN